MLQFRSAYAYIRPDIVWTGLFWKDTDKNINPTSPGYD